MIDLAVPGLDTVAVPESAEAGRERFRSLLLSWLPDLTAERLDLLSEGITAFRERLTSGGWVYHGVAGGPPNEHVDLPTSWHYLAAVGPAPADEPRELLLAHLLGWSRLPDGVTPTSLDTRMDGGLGFHADVRQGAVLRGVEPDPATADQPFGLAAYVAVDASRARALLVVGMSLLPGTTATMASLAALMAQRSTFRD